MNPHPHLPENELGGPRPEPGSIREPSTTFKVVALVVGLSVVAFLGYKVLWGSDSDPAALEAIHNSAAAMEEANTFRALGSIHLDAPEGFGPDVTSTLDAVVDLQSGTSRMEARSDDGDAWTEIVLDGTWYRAQGIGPDATDWCAFPLANNINDPFLQTGSSFPAMVDALRTAESATRVDSGDPSVHTYEVKFSPVDGSVTQEFIDDTVKISLDDQGRPARIAYALNAPAPGSATPARTEFDWTLSGWGQTNVQVEKPPKSHVQTPPNCV